MFPSFGFAPLPPLKKRRFAGIGGVRKAGSWGSVTRVWDRAHGQPSLLQGVALSRWYPNQTSTSSLQMVTNRHVEGEERKKESLQSILSIWTIPMC